jgi:BatD DUF11 like domain
MERHSWKKRWNYRARRVVSLRHALGVLGFLAMVTSSFAVTFTASLERDTITFGESVGLSLTFDGAQPDGTPTIPSIANLQIAYNGPSSQISYVNGQVSSKITYNYTVTPRQAGDFTIPALSCEVGGQKLTTQPIRLKVLKPGAPAPAAVASGAQPAFLRLVLPKTNVYLGEIITGEFQLYLRDGVQGANQFQFTATPTEGFSVGKMVESQRRRVQMGNFGYTVIPITVLLTPIKTGPLSIGPVTASVVIELASDNRRRDPFRDPFGMFSNNERRQIALATELETVQCLPLPEENKPAGFNGAIGNYTMAVNVGPTNLATGDPITVRVMITGRGSLSALTLPEQAAWHDFKTYPPTANVETSDPLGLQGTKTFEQIVTPESTDIKELPPFSFSFFDPDARDYRTLSQPAVRLVVRPGGSAPAPMVAATTPANNDTPPPQRDIVPLKTRLGTVTQTHSAIGRQKIFLALNTMPALAFIGVVIWRKRTDALANNPRLRRERQVAESIRAGLERLREQAAQNKSEEFFAGLVHLLREKLGERLDCPASAITEAVIDEKLRPRGLPDSTLDELHALFQSCNLARYAPVESSRELAAIIPRLESALKKLEAIKA